MHTSNLSTSYRPKTFYLILLTQTLSMIGSSMTSFAVGIWLYATTGDVTPLALVAFFSLAPGVVLSNIAGAMADRGDRRRLMILSDVGSAVATGFLLLSFATNSFEIWHLYVVTLLGGIAKVFQYPAFAASVTLLIPDKERDRANALMQLSGSASGLIAPVATGLAYSAIGVSGVIVIDLLTFAVAVLTLGAVRIPQPTTNGKESTSMLQSILEGFAYLWKHKPFLVMMGFAALINFLFGMMSVLTTPYLLSRLNNDETILGWLMGFMNIGAIVGGILISVLSGKLPRIHTTMISLILLSVSVIAMGMGQSVAVLATTLFAMMFFVMSTNIPTISLLQAKIPADMQGRVMATMTQVSMIAMPIATLIVGPLADNVFEPLASQEGWVFAPLVGTGAAGGMGLLLVLAGGVALIASIAAYALPSIRHLERDIPDAAPVISGGVDALPVESENIPVHTTQELNPVP